MVVLSLEEYSRLTNTIENALDVADIQAATTSERMSHSEVFSKLKKKVDG